MGTGAGVAAKVNRTALGYSKYTAKDGQRFGDLRFRTVIKLPDGRMGWELACVCGNSVRGPVHRFVYGQVTSCGCMRQERARRNGTVMRKAFGEAAANSLYYRYQNKAAKRGITFTLSKAHFLELTRLPCTYCGCLPAQETTKYKANYGTYVYNGIDRLDSALGYTEDNVAPCCKLCNQAKQQLSVTDFLAHLDAIAGHIQA